tara:strand:+ start:2284 stop:3399 length:1116 start_codon:yes stop_codon:yes gene_type:complete
MSLRYLYLDDEQEQQTKSIVELLESEVDGLEIITDTPKSFGDEIKRLKSEEYDGLMFDLRLDVKSEAEYRAFTLAQEIRTRATEGTMRDIPIVVCSTDTKLKKSYNKDATGHDLFDRKYLKEEELVDNSERVAQEIVALAIGYKEISKIKGKARGVGPQLKQFFGLKDEELLYLDIRLIEHFGNVEGKLPVHEYARFILNEMILTSGPLVDESILAARLGVNKDSEGFQDLINNKLKSSIYTGPFSTYWKRWWWHSVENWWNKKVKENIAFMSASERLEALKKATKLENLNVQESRNVGDSSYFWTICELYKTPIDPVDGFLVQGKEVYAWQDNKYMSYDAVLTPDSKALNIFPHQTEIENVKELIKANNQ